MWLCFACLSHRGAGFFLFGPRRRCRYIGSYFVVVMHLHRDDNGLNVK